MKPLIDFKSTKYTLNKEISSLKPRILCVATTVQIAPNFTMHIKMQISYFKDIPMFLCFLYKTAHIDIPLHFIT